MGVNSITALKLGGVALERKSFFGRSERPKKIGTDQFFWVRFPVAHEATRQG